MLANRDGSPASGMINPAVLAQMGMGGMMGGMGPRAGQPQNVPFGPGGMGGGQQADFDSLIELITSTIQPTTWDEVGGPGSIAEFATNLSLVISQTQEVHEQIADLLEQLRRLQDCRSRSKSASSRSTTTSSSGSASTSNSTSPTSQRRRQ